MKRRTGSRVAQNKPPRRDELEKRLMVLEQGSTVALQINHERQSGKKTREINLLMLIAPGHLYGMGAGKYLVSIPGKGSSIVDVNSDKNVSGLILAGVPTRLARELDRALKQIQEK